MRIQAKLLKQEIAEYSDFSFFSPLGVWFRARLVACGVYHIVYSSVLCASTWSHGHPWLQGRWENVIVSWVTKGPAKTQGSFSNSWKGEWVSQSPSNFSPKHLLFSNEDTARPVVSSLTRALICKLAADCYLRPWGDERSSMILVRPA